MSGVLSSTNLPYLEYLLTSGATSHITVLDLSENKVFAKEAAGQSMGEVLASMPQLCELGMNGCHFTLNSWRHIIDGISRGCYQMRKLNLSGNAVFADAEATRLLGIALESMSQLCVLGMRDCSMNLRSWSLVIDGISQGGYNMTLFDCAYSDLTDDSEYKFRNILRRRFGLTIWAYKCSMSDECGERLRATFGGRFENNFLRGCCVQ
ncbi:hypothetical protein LSAT2_016491 [Lamellibrachia satsuma]|nr:hypothetical protein LSAT2_016491 [Lamellibrachia satsuma]